MIYITNIFKITNHKCNTIRSHLEYTQSYTTIKYNSHIRLNINFVKSI